MPDHLRRPRHVSFSDRYDRILKARSWVSQRSDGNRDRSPPSPASPLF
ncbi:hypothetical protein [Azospirillum melinis]